MLARDHHRRRVRRRLARRAAAQRLRRRLPRQGDRRPRCSSAPRCRSSAGWLADELQQLGRRRAPDAQGRRELDGRQRQDREGNTQEARRGAQEGPGRQVAGPQRRRRAARRAVRALGASAPQHRRSAWQDVDARRPRARSPTPDVVSRDGHRRAVPQHGQGGRRSPARAGRVRLRRSPACVANVAQVGFKPSTPGASSPTSRSSTRSRASRTSSARTRSSRPARTSARSRVVGAIVALARVPQARRARPRSSACRPRELAADARAAWSCGIAQRAARRLPRSSASSTTPSSATATRSR